MTAAVDVANYTCISQSKCDNVRAGGVAIYQHDSALDKAVSHAIEKLDVHYDEQLTKADDFGDICAVEMSIEGINTILFSMYISPCTTIKQKKYFITRNLMMYTHNDSPIVVTGDFNIDVSKTENIEFVDFMLNYMKLSLVSNSTQPTTLGGSCIDLIFARNIRTNVERYISYFSYHRPLLCKIRL